LRVLQICFRVPYPPDDGGAIAMYGITRNLSLKGHEVTVLAVNTPKHFQQVDVLGGIARLIPVFIDTTINRKKALLNLFKPIPYIAERFISDDFEKQLEMLLREEQFDVVHFEGTYVAWYVDSVRKWTNIPVVLRSHNLEHMIWQRLSENEPNVLKRLYFRRMARELKLFERTYYAKFDAIAAITPEDALRIKQMGVSVPCHFIPAGVDLDRFVLRPDIKPLKNTCFILSALEWLPNQEALMWFLENVWPEASAVLPHLELHVAGKGTPDYIKELNIKNVFIHGYVDDASVFIQQYDLMLVPLLSGGGMRLKIVEGMALEKCIFASSVGAEGIDCSDGKNIVICDDAERWVEKIKDYFRNRENYDSVGKNAGLLIQNEYANPIVIDRLINLYKSLAK